MFETSESNGVILPGNTSLNLVLAYHHTSADSERLKKYIDECDIYIPELDGWTPDAQRALQSISNGDAHLYQSLATQHRSTGLNHKIGVPEQSISEETPIEMLVKNIFNSQKKISIVDIPSKHPVTYDLHQSFRIRFGQLYNPDFGKVLKTISSNAQQEAISQTNREKYILGQIAPTIEAAIADDPELAQKDHLSVVMTMGAIHTTLHHSLLNDLRVTGTGYYRKTIEPGDEIFGHREELVRRYQFGLPVRKQLIARAFADLDIMNNMQSHPAHGADLIRIVRSVSSQLTMPEIRALHESAVQRKDTAIITKIGRLLELAHTVVMCTGPIILDSIVQAI